MSIDRALGAIDCLLDVFDTIEKQHSTDSCSNITKTCTKQTTSCASTQHITCFSSLDGIEESHQVQVTGDLELLTEKWKSAGLPENDELPAFCNHIGKVVEIESSDDTLQIQWGNYDTCWLPAFACGPAPSGAKLTIPGTNNSWLDDSKAVGAEYNEEKREEEERNENEENVLLANVEDPAAQVGNTLRVTTELNILEEKWKSTELQKEKKLERFLGAIGAVQQVAEDDDTVELKWENDTTTWLPIQACMDAKGAQSTSPQET